MRLFESVIIQQNNNSSCHQHPRSVVSPRTGIWSGLQNQAGNPSCGAGHKHNQKVVSCPHNNHATIVRVDSSQQVSIVAYKVQSYVRPRMSFSAPTASIANFYMSQSAWKAFPDQLSMVSLCPSFKVWIVFRNRVYNIAMVVY